MINRFPILARVLAPFALSLVFSSAPTYLFAAPMRLDATSLNPVASSFFVDFADTGDGLFELQELSVFSGITLFGTESFSVLNSVPDVPGFSVQSGPADWCTFQGAAFPCWGFSNPGIAGGGGSSPGIFSYRLTALTVPEPATLTMMLIGLFGLGISARHRRVKM